MLNEVKKFIQNQRDEYLNDWGNGNSEKFEADDHYKWMSNFILGYERVFEVGTGDGRATLELAKRGHKIISIDENTSCLNVAQERLKSHGFSVCRLNRECIALAPPNKYRISYGKIECVLSDDIDIYLIESDILNDSELKYWLRSLVKFDAVICWLMGTNGARQFNEAVNMNQMPTPFHYRIFVQNDVYELANDILRSDGILHIIDRGGELDTQEMVDELILSHEDQSRVTNLIVQKSVEVRIYEDPSNGFDIGTVSNVNDTIVKSSFERKFLRSIISKKPTFPNDGQLVEPI